MKYSTGYIQEEAKWAVTTKAGKEFFPNSLTDCEVTAKRLAREFTMRWHFEQVTQLFQEGVDKGEFDEDDNWGDYVA